MGLLSHHLPYCSSCAGNGQIAVLAVKKGLSCYFIATRQPSQYYRPYMKSFNMPYFHGTITDIPSPHTDRKSLLGDPPY